MKAAMSKMMRSSWFKGMKVALMLLSFAFIYFHVSQAEVVSRLVLIKMRFAGDETTRYYIYGAILLMPLNWMCETLKWQWLTSSFYRQSPMRAGRGVLAGVAISFFTPNRTGDFAGRILMLPAASRINGALFSIAGSLAQLLVTVSAGGVALMFLAGALFGDGRVPRGVLYILIPSIILALHVLFISMPVLGDKLSQLRLRYSWVQKLKKIRHIDSMVLAKVYILSIIRYAVFTCQFYLLLHAFGLEANDYQVIALIMISFLLITVIPSFAMSEIGVRGSVTVFLFSSVISDLPSVLVASTGLWLINIVLPALIGAAAMLYFKIEE